MEEKERIKIGIVASGGGLSCAYAVGVVLALVEKYNFTQPYMIVSGSGSTSTFAYYVAGQYRSIKNIWENLLSTDKFVSFKRPNRILDIDYLIDEVFKKQDPLDVKKVKSSPIKFFISATSLKTGQLEYFSNREEKDIFELLRASSAVPLAFNKRVKIGEDYYVDGCLGNSFYAHIEKAFHEGADAVIAIDNTNDSRWDDIFIKTWGFFRRREFRKGFRVFSYDKPTRSNLITLKAKKLPTSTLDNKREHILKAIHIGYEDLVNSKEVADLFSIKYEIPGAKLGDVVL